MRTVRTGLVALLIIGLATSVFAGDLASSIAKAAAEQQERVPRQPSNKPLVWTGAALFVGGMAVGLFSFINNQNGSYSEFGEADAVNKKVGAIGLGTAFVGGTLMFLGSHRAARAPAVRVGVRNVAVSKRLSW